MTISIIIPAYNCERYIEKCLDSVISQEGAELDIIVVNDASTDGTAEILEKYKGSIRVETLETNSGVSAARNRGISMIRGDYVMFLDGDDYLAEGTISRLVSVIEETDTDIVKFRCVFVYPDGRVKDRPDQFETYDVVEKKDFKTKIYPYFIKGIRLNNLCIGIYRSSIIKGHKFREDIEVAEDVIFSLGVYTKAQRVVTLPENLYNYYQSGTGLTGTGVPVWKKYKCNYIFAAETIKYLKDWDMDTLGTRILVYFRPIRVTFDKIKRIIAGRR